MRFLLSLLAVALTLTTAAPAHASPKTEKRLRAKIERLERSRDAWVDRYHDARSDLEDAQAGLPLAISTVPAVNFRALVLDPARDRWRALGFCAESSSLTRTNDAGGSTTVWSVEFHSWDVDELCG